VQDRPPLSRNRAGRAAGQVARPARPLASAGPLRRSLLERPVLHRLEGRPVPGPGSPCKSDRQSPTSCVAMGPVRPRRGFRVSRPHAPLSCRPRGWWRSPRRAGRCKPASWRAARSRESGGPSVALIRLAGHSRRRDSPAARRPGAARGPRDTRSSKAAPVEPARSHTWSLRNTLATGAATARVAVPRWLAISSLVKTGQPAERDLPLTRNRTAGGERARRRGGRGGGTARSPDQFW
jgi:hypothetical protein